MHPKRNYTGESLGTPGTPIWADPGPNVEAPKSPCRSLRAFKQGMLGSAGAELTSDFPDATLTSRLLVLPPRAGQKRTPRSVPGSSRAVPCWDRFLSSLGRSYEPKKGTAFKSSGSLRDAPASA